MSAQDELQAQAHGHPQDAQQQLQVQQQQLDGVAMQQQMHNGETPPVTENSRKSEQPPP